MNFSDALTKMLNGGKVTWSNAHTKYYFYIFYSSLMYGIKENDYIHKVLLEIDPLTAKEIEMQNNQGHYWSRMTLTECLNYEYEIYNPTVTL